MNIPDKLKIGGHLVEIDLSQKLESDNGKTEFGEGKIYICSSIPQTLKESTLIHEILHYCNSTLGGETTVSHSLLDSLAEQLYQVLKDNNLLK